jgi:16S rRNA (adenine1518-N6/adenine1519-N6)-dimethyltransferase
VLTDILAERAERLICIELDRVLAAQLSLKYSRKPHVEIIEADVLGVDLSNVILRKPGPLLQTRDLPRRAKAIGNLPYYITSDILLRLFKFQDAFSEIVIMVQREVGDRLAAQPGTRDYGLLTATAQLHARVENLFHVPPGAFDPPPKVHSSVLRLTMEPKARQLGIDIEPFDAFLKLSFGQKRKTWVNNLKEHYEAKLVRSAMDSTGLRPDARAEAVPLDKMAAVVR